MNASPESFRICRLSAARSYYVIATEEQALRLCERYAVRFQGTRVLLYRVDVTGQSHIYAETLFGGDDIRKQGL